MNKNQPKKMKRRFKDWYSKLQFDAFSDEEKQFLETLYEIPYNKDEVMVYVYPTGKIEYRFNKRVTREILKVNDLEQ